MKIVHIVLVGPFTENMSYQENLIPKYNRIGENDVEIIASCLKFIDGQIRICDPEIKLLENNCILRRLLYKKIFNNFITEKFRIVDGLYNILSKIKPDVIFVHDAAFYSIKDVIDYKKNNKRIHLFVDIHSDYNNSATNILSYNILHKMIYKKWYQSILPYIDKLWPVSYESMIFSNEMYNIPKAKMELYPLGGLVFDKLVRKEKRDRRRQGLQLRADDILLVHSGKMDKYKRTCNILKAFIKTDAENLKLAIIGTFADDVKEEAENLVHKDDRVMYLGWKNSDELLEYLCASDLYVQPGGQSATMQNAACCGSALALYPHESHKYLMGDTVFYIDTVEDMKKLFKQISENPEILEEKRKKSFELAKEKLDYAKLAKRLYE